ncbi:PD-(D/E)XK nuclease superfamily protein [Arachidicoccus rhizosphaerae]|uniref:PD-(D/E)XK nuclease superfamily protein n=1 Tax=Arachidicoccus rhizosphaerae TaxID=551991 RepID=A0A1H4D0U6_9BACT|nr:ATP-binding protein [Arachidicoccus rhizosphaerae]SEA66334.1 PD-(D/E)XK nuclease superfamily protein [Arachidicoccus rhizosphaerae]
MLRKYPIGIQSFREIRQGGYVYIDKTKIIHRLVETGKYYFLSRPRRFGKSLLVDTIEELFTGSKELFEGLWIHDKWDWTQTNPVIHFDFSSIGVNTGGLEAAIYGALEDNAGRLGVTLTKKGYDLQFKELIEKASAKGQVVILIDEYDKPIIDFLEEPEEVDANRSVMKSFYSILKGSDKHIRLLLITGVSQFSQVSIFSDLNNLRNITLSQQYGDIVGITQTELETAFAPEITELSKTNPDIVAQIKDWYNGYTWNLKTWAYNPFSLLNFMAEPVFRNYWYATGTPTFLFKLLKKMALYDIESIEMGSLELSDFNVEKPSPGALLFQTGYLTLKSISPDGDVFELGFPNREVKASLLDGLLSTYRETYPVGSIANVAKIKTALRNGDIGGLISQLNSLVTTIPYDHWNAGTESIFTVVTFLAFKLAGIDVHTEVHSAKGRCDVLAMTERYIYVIELKLDGTAEEALQQIKDKGYLQPYVADTRKKLAVGITFSSEKREVSQYQVAEC